MQTLKVPWREDSQKKEPLTSSEGLLSDHELASRFLDVIPLAMQALRTEMRQTRGTDLTVPQFRMLAHLWCEPASNRKLADNLGISVAASSRMVDWLIKHELAEKAQDETDRRQVVVQLTPAGRKTFELNQKQTRLAFEKKIKTLSPQAKHDLSRGIVALRKAIVLIS